MMILQAEPFGPEVHARAWRLGVVRQLLGDLDTATVPGLHFTMEKVVGLLRQEVGAAEPELNDLERRVISRALTDLGLEQSRLLPNSHLFVARSEMIADTLALI